MTELQLIHQERTNTGTAWTRNDSFEKNGYLVTTRINHDPDEDFVFISTSKYFYANYKPVDKKK